MSKKGTVATKPHMMKLWDFEKNTLNPEKVSAKSAEKVWWKCPTCGYSWEGSIRGKKDEHCPVCDGSNRIIPGYTDFRSKWPELAKDAIDELNPNIDLNNEGEGSHKRIKWRCHICGYEWMAPIYGRIRRDSKPYKISKCPVCAKNMRKDGFHITHPQLIKYYSQNNEKPLSDESINWHSRCLWACNKHGDFKAAISSMVRSINSGNTGCPYCHGTLVKREDSFGFNYPELLSEWDDEIDPFNVTCNSKLEIRWKCEHGHKWTAQIGTRAAGYGYCRECYPRGKNYTSFMELFPGIEKYYSEKNGDDLSLHTSTETNLLWWKCDKNHEFQDSCLNIYQRGHFSCLICNHRVIQPGVNDFGTEYPEYAKELIGDSSTVSPIGNTQMTFRCSFGHEFRRSPRIHIERKGLCPVCSKYTLVKGINDLLTICSEIEELWDYSMNGISPSECLHNEYRSYYYMCNKGHSFRTSIDTLRKHDFKCPECYNFRIQKDNPITVTDPDLAKEWSPNNERGADTCEATDVYKALWICPKCHGEYRAEVRARDVGDEACPYCKDVKVLPGLNDLSTTNPEIAEIWSPNNSRQANEVSAKSALQALWLCKVCNGEYSRGIRYREVGDCPYCADEKVLKGFNDLATTNPEIAANWSSNNNRDVESITFKSRVWYKWICPTCNGEYSSRPCDRELNDCPYCNEKSVKSGINDLRTTHPRLADEYSDNNDRPVNKVAKFYREKAFWCCPDCGGEYSAKINEREVGDDSCPYCNEDRLLAGLNDLTTTHPEIAVQWSKKNDRPATSVMKRYTRRVFWTCPECNNDFMMSVKEKELDDCPICIGKRLAVGFNDLATTHPELTKEYSPLNERGPETLIKDMYMFMLWDCPTCGGTYRYLLKDREVGDDSCPYCNNRKTLKGFNSLENTDPQLANEWASSNESTPSEVRKNMAISADWECPTCGGIYRYPIKDREVGDDNCPYCNNKKARTGYNDFATLHPDLMKEWMEVENLLIGVYAEELLETSSIKVFWKCSECGYIYQASIESRITKKKRGQKSCPYCNGRRQQSGHFYNYVNRFTIDDLLKN